MNIVMRNMIVKIVYFKTSSLEFVVWLHFISVILVGCGPVVPSSFYWKFCREKKRERNQLIKKIDLWGANGGSLVRLSIIRIFVSFRLDKIELKFLN